MALAPEGESSVISGPYRASYNGLDLGQITTDGYELTWQNSSYDINADMTGEGTTTDAIYNGTSCQISFTLEHWNAYGVEQMLWWMGSDQSYRFGHISGIGLRHFDFAKPLVLESCFWNGISGLSDANPDIDPLDITFGKAILSNSRAVSFLMATKPRYIPVTLDIFPYNVTVTGTEPDLVTTVTRPNSCEGFRFWDCTRNPNQPAPFLSLAANSDDLEAAQALPTPTYETTVFTP